MYLLLVLLQGIMDMALWTWHYGQGIMESIIYLLLVLLL